MGVDFYTCAKCERNFPDCGNYYSCEECSNVFCSDKCANPEPFYDPLDEDGGGEEIERYTCCICRKEDANDYILLNALLRHFKLTREQALKIWQEEKGA